MIVQSTKLRRLTIGVQLLAGIGLLTASYLTTEEDWTNEFIEAAIQSEQTATKNALRDLKAGLNC